MPDTKTSSTQPLSVIRTPDELQKRLTTMGRWMSLPHVTFAVHWLDEGEQRFDASYYANEVFTAMRAVRDCGFEVKLLAEISSELFYPNRFKRIYAKTKEEGIPFLTASVMLHFRPTSELFLANISDSLASCLIEPEMLLITRSGSVGRCVIVGERLSHFVVSDDAIRILTKDVPIGYLYAFLASRIGQALLSKDQYGSAIKHLEPHILLIYQYRFCQKRCRMLFILRLCKLMLYVKRRISCLTKLTSCSIVNWDYLDLIKALSPICLYLNNQQDTLKCPIHMPSPLEV